MLEALHAREGLICVVGAGGKKTTLYRLAQMHRGRVGITSTVLMPPFPRTLAAAEVIVDEESLASAVVKIAATERMVAFAVTSTKRGRLGGLRCPSVVKIHEAAGFDVTLIKCDGARGRRIKAPASDEPPIPEGATTLIPVVSARVIGIPLSDRIAHRVDRVTAVTGARPGEIITSEHVARLLTSEQAALKGAGQATVVPLINMVDNAELERLARDAAARALRATRRFDKVVLTCMRREQPIIAIVGR